MGGPADRVMISGGWVLLCSCVLAPRAGLYLDSAGRCACHIIHHSLELVCTWFRPEGVLVTYFIAASSWSVPGFGRKIYLSHISSQPRAGLCLVSAGRCACRIIHRSLELVCDKKYRKPSIR